MGLICEMVLNLIINSSCSKLCSHNEANHKTNQSHFILACCMNLAGVACSDPENGSNSVNLGVSMWTYSTSLCKTERGARWERQGFFWEGKPIYCFLIFKARKCLELGGKQGSKGKPQHGTLVILIQRMFYCTVRFVNQEILPVCSNCYSFQKPPCTMLEHSCQYRSGAYYRCHKLAKCFSCSEKPSVQ